MRVGVLVHLEDAWEEKLKDVKEMGMESCQLVCWREELFTDELAERINRAREIYGVKYTAFWCGYPGPIVWNFYEGQETLGLVPAAYRDRRLATLCKGADFAKKLGIRDVITHVGFLPENPYDSNYHGVLCALKYLVSYLKNNGQNFLFETGQETPATLLRVIEDIGLDNVGINLDPANLILYGKANPVDAMDTFGKYVMGVHGKDGLYPTNGRDLGLETPLGEGKVNYPMLLKKLKEAGYDGDISIEREIEGPKQREDILKAKAMLEELIQKL